MVNVPLGYKFAPTRVELINHYLKRKINGQPFGHPSLPIIFEDDIYRAHPRDIVREAKESTSYDESFMGPGAYFFTTLRNSSKNGTKNKSRCVGVLGTWEQDSMQPIKDRDNKTGEMVRIGYYKYFYFKLENNQTSPDKWQMHEYSIDHRTSTVLCHILQKVPKKVATKKPNTTTQTPALVNNGIDTSNLRAEGDTRHRVNRLVTQGNIVLNRFIEKSPNYPINQYLVNGIDTRNSSFEVGSSSRFPIGVRIEEEYKNDLYREFLSPNNVGPSNMGQIIKSDNSFCQQNQELFVFDDDIDALIPFEEKLFYGLPSSSNGVAPACSDVSPVDDTVKDNGQAEPPNLDHLQPLRRQRRS